MKLSFISGSVALVKFM